MPADFPQVTWDETLIADAEALVRLAAAEDLSDGVDWTTSLTVDPDRHGEAAVVAREAGIVAGLGIGPLVFAQFGADAKWLAEATDGDSVAAGQSVAVMRGRAADLLTCERTVLNFMGRLSGIATAARTFVDAAANRAVGVFDTRKTTPGWRRLEKYAVACGGGCNHRLGLSEAVLIKDNHLVLSDQQGLTPADAVARSRQRLAEQGRAEMVVEVEVDTLDQLRVVLAADAKARPDIVLLDNMKPEELAEAVAIRDQAESHAVLEASGGVNLGTIGAIARTGVERISVGAMTHSARTLDLGLDWKA